MRLPALRRRERAGLLPLLALGPLLFCTASCTSHTRLSPYRERLRAEGVAKVIPIGNLDVHYVERGTGPAVVLVHGYGGSCYDWRNQLEPLAAAGFRALALDLKGAGYTSRPDDGHYSAVDQADLVWDFIVALGLPKVHLIGNSYGGGVSLITALKHPDRVQRLVLLDSMCYRQKYPFYIGVVRMPILSNLALTLVPDRLMVNYVLHDGYCDKTKIPPEVTDEYTYELGVAGTRAALIRIARQLVPDDMEEQEKLIGAVRQPALILWGDHDRIIPLANGERLHRELRNSRFMVIENCGHMPNQERPEVVNPLIVEFLKEP